MNSKLTYSKINIADIKIKKSASNLVYIQLVYICFVFFLIDVLHFPSGFTYITDIIMVLSFLYSFGKVQKSISYAKAKVQFYLIVAITLCMCIGAFINFVNPALFVWGLRNNLRFYIFFISCVTLLEIKDISNIYKIFIVVFWANIVVSSYQYFILGIKQDYLGGLFGITQGCNAYSVVMINIVMAYKLRNISSSKSSILKLLIYIIASLYLATLAELKVVYVELIVILVLSLFSKKPNLKTIAVIVFGIIGLIIGVLLLNYFDPNSLAMFLDPDSLDHYLNGEGYTGSGDLNRFTAVSQIYEMFFKNDFIRTLFGFGLGSCDTSRFSFFQSDFFNRYEYLHYRWFTQAWVFLEQGAVGLILLVLFIVAIIVYCLKHRKRYDTNNYMYSTFLFAVTTIIGIIYNVVLQIEACYLIAFVLAVPFIIVKSNNQK